MKLDRTERAGAYIGLALLTMQLFWALPVFCLCLAVREVWKGETP